jgi:hypothetical protein
LDSLYNYRNKEKNEFLFMILVAWQTSGAVSQDIHELSTGNDTIWIPALPLVYGIHQAASADCGGPLCGNATDRRLRQVL